MSMPLPQMPSQTVPDVWTSAVEASKASAELGVLSKVVASSAVPSAEAILLLLDGRSSVRMSADRSMEDRERTDSDRSVLRSLDRESFLELRSR